MTLMTALLLIAGLALLVVGAEALVRGASKLAAVVGIPPLIIGLTVVAYGTSAPELAVSVMSSLNGQADIALGNVVGSNIFNVLFILGLSALIAPLAVSRQLIRLDVPIMIGVSVLVMVLGLDGNLGLADGAFLFMGGVGYTLFLIWQARQDKNSAGNSEEDEYAREYGDRPAVSVQQWLINLGLIVVGLGLLVLGSRWLVDGAVTVAKALGLSELVIGLTIIAAGTSLPELATSVIASLRGERDIAVGNVVGSNIFNILVVLGLSSLVSPSGVNVPGAALRLDMPVMIAVALACLPIFFTGSTISRWEGGVFLAYYAAYTLYLILDSTQHQSLPIFSAAMLLFVLPITAITLSVLMLRALRRPAAQD